MWYGGVSWRCSERPPVSCRWLAFWMHCASTLSCYCIPVSDPEPEKTVRARRSRRRGLGANDGESPAKGGTAVVAKRANRKDDRQGFLVFYGESVASLECSHDSWTRVPHPRRWECGVRLWPTASVSGLFAVCVRPRKTPGCSPRTGVRVQVFCSTSESSTIRLFIIRASHTATHLSFKLLLPLRPLRFFLVHLSARACHARVPGDRPLHLSSFSSCPDRLDPQASQTLRIAWGPAF